MANFNPLFGKGFLLLRYAFLLFLACICFQSCIGEDVINDFVEAQVRIDNPIIQIQTNYQYSYKASYLNNVGQTENAQIRWESSDDTVISIDANGNATALSAGSATISAIVESNGSIIRKGDSVSVTDEEVGIVPETTSKEGTIATTSSYQLEGGFTITANNGNLVLDIKENYKASSSLPGLYLYLTNNPNSVNGALEVGAVKVFNGAHNYTVPNVGLNDYSHLLYWCKPFSVKVGEGKIE